MTEEEKKAFDNSPLTGSIQSYAEEKLEGVMLGGMPIPEQTRVPNDVELLSESKEKLLVVEATIDDLAETIKDMRALLQEHERSRYMLRALIDAAKADPKFVDGE